MAGTYDAQGVWMHDEADTFPATSEVLNRGQRSISDALIPLAYAAPQAVAAAAAAQAAQAAAEAAALITVPLIAPLDEGTAALIETPGSATETALSNTFASSASLPIDGARATGVDPTGVTECAAAIQAVLDANAKVGDADGQKIVRFQGVFNIASTVVIKGHADLSAAVFNYSGADVAVQIGNSAAGQLTRIAVRVGEIICTTKPGTGWVAGTVGLRVSNIFRSQITFQNIRGFDTGLSLVGDAGYAQAGVAYCTFHMGTLNNNQINQKMSVITGGAGTPFVNQNTFIGGSWAHAEGTYPAAGQRHLLMGQVGTVGSINNNTWLNPSLEGSTEKYAVECNGNENVWISPRFETTGHAPPVLWNERAARNLIVGGFSSDDIVPTIVSGAAANNVIGTKSIKFESVTDGGVVLAPFSGGTTAALTVMRGDWQRLGDTTAAGYTARIRPSTALFKSATDTVDRVTIDGLNKLVNFGSGSAAQDASIGRLAVGVIGTGIGHALRSGLNVTASRPGAVAVGAGSRFYDTTLSRPIWSDGTIWRDAMGTAV